MNEFNPLQAEQLRDWLLLPGDAVLYALLTWLPGVARFVGLSTGDYGSGLSIGLSIILWLLALIAVGVALTAVRDFDRRLTAFVVGCFREAQRLGRVLRRRLTIRAGQLFRRREGESVRVEPVILESLERAMLRCLTNIDDHAVLTLDELAARLNRPLPQVRAALLHLTELALIERGQDKYERREGLRITTAGQMVLIAH